MSYRIQWQADENNNAMQDNNCRRQNNKNEAAKIIRDINVFHMKHCVSVTDIHYRLTNKTVY